MGEVIILNKYATVLILRICYSYFITRMFPEWRVYTSFYADHTEAALSLDAKRSSHPIQVPIPDANEINQYFDSLTYSKAAAGMFACSLT